MKNNALLIIALVLMALAASCDKKQEPAPVTAFPPSDYQDYQIEEAMRSADEWRRNIESSINQIAEDFQKSQIIQVYEEDMNFDSFFDFLAFGGADGKGDGPGIIWDGRYRYKFKDGLLTSIETYQARRMTGEIIGITNVMSIKRYNDKMEVYSNGALQFTVYYEDENAMSVVYEVRPSKWRIIKNNNEIVIYGLEAVWSIKITLGEEINFDFNEEMSLGVWPWHDFVVTDKEPSSVRYRIPLYYRYEITEDGSYEWCSKDTIGGDIYTVIPTENPFDFYVVDVLTEYFCDGRPFISLFWGQLITRSQNGLSALHE
jgi:hypothetical protein